MPWYKANGPPSPEARSVVSYRFEENTAAQTFVRAKTQTDEDLVTLRKVDLSHREGKRRHVHI